MNQKLYNTVICIYVGTPYEMGFAHGTLLTEEATDLLNSVWKYLEDQVVRKERIPK